jgi:hypothetical protein
MPSETGVRYLIELVKDKKPYFILTIGGGSISADILSGLTPTVCQTLGPSGLTLTEGQFQVIGREKTKEEAALIKSFGFSDDHIISAQFTWNNLKPQVSTRKRNELNIPDDRFILLIVGVRLDDEVSQEFLDMLLSTIHADTHFVFAGEFVKHEMFCEKNSLFQEHSTNLGFQSDMLAICELCDFRQ